MKKKQDIQENKSLKKAAIFLGVVILLVMLSVIFRIFSVVKDSSFNGKDRFTISVVVSSDKAHIVSFNPKDKTVSRVYVSGDRKRISPGRILGVPVDGELELKRDDLKFNSGSSILTYALTHPETVKKGLNSYDLLRLYIFTRSLASGSYLEESVSTTDNSMNLDRIALKLMADGNILNEQKSIEIVNGTSINGLGKRLERIFQNSGGNVVAVSNSPTVIKKSKIYIFNEYSYTYERIQKLLDYPSDIVNRREIADIKVVIGLDGIRGDIY